MILQGLNYRSSHSVVVIECDAPPKTDIIDLVNSFHEVFLKGYTVEGNTIYIETKFPALWGESAEALKLYASGEWNYDQTREFIVGDVIKGQFYSMSAIPTLHAAAKRNLEITQYIIRNTLFRSDTGRPTEMNKKYRIGTGKQSEVINSAADTKNSSLGKDTQRDKVLTNMLISKLGMPIAPWAEVHSEEHLREIFDDFPKPLVIKPGGLTQGSGVTTNIVDIEKAIKAYRHAKEKVDAKVRQNWQKKILIQQQVSGEDYRLLVIGGKLRIATKRLPAFVTGDGESTIEQLINQTNTDPRRDLGNPTHTLKPIVIDQMLHDFLDEKGLNIQYVPATDERVYVRKVASMSQGGITEDFTDQVHPQIRYIAESLARSAHVNVMGVDVICNDISKPLTIDNGSIIEMNTMPEIYLNAFPVLGRQYENIGDMILDSLFEGKPEVKQIVAVGGDLDSLNSYLARMSDFSNGNDVRIGVVSGNTLYINGEQMQQMENFHDCIDALKGNALYDILVIHHNDEESLRQNGAGFYRVDTMIIDQPDPQFVQYQTEGLIGEILSWEQIK